MSQLLLSNLGVVCPTCDEFNPPKATKCASCGSPVYVDVRAKGAAPAAGAAASKPPLAAAPPATARPSAPHANVPPPAAQRPVQPPGMRPSARPAQAPVTNFQDPGYAIPASELVRKPASSPASKFGLTVVAGSGKGQRFRLAAATCQVGRSRGSIMFPEDPFLSAIHATFIVRDGTLLVKDENSVSGIYVAIAGQEALAPGAYFSAGRRLFRFTGALVPPAPQPGAPIVYGGPSPSGNIVYGVEEILVGNRAGRAVVTGNPLLTIGQSLCDLSFPKDEGLATRHCELTPTGMGALLRDLSGGLGTYVRVLGERMLNFGDRLRIGEQVLQVES